MKQQSQTPTYFFVAGASQVELMNTSRLTPLRKDGKIPHDNPRFIADIFGQRVRHTIACIGCNFIEKPEDVSKMNKVYEITYSPRGGLNFGRVPIDTRHTMLDRAHFLRIEQTGKVLAIIVQNNR